MWNRIRNACVGIVALAIIIGFWAAVLSTGVPQAVVREGPSVVRDIVVFHYAAAREGEPVDLPEDFRYFGGLPAHPGLTWGIITNSPYLAKMERLIVPYMAYEDVARTGVYPGQIIFVPIQDEGAFHLLGAARSDAGSIILNERVVIGPNPDERTLLATMVHEIIHVQGNSFSMVEHPRIHKILRDNPVGSPERREALRNLSVEVESHTSAATLEVLAAMCNYRNELACLAFWKNVRSTASSNLGYRLGPVWETYENIFFRDAARARAFNKSRRFWNSDEERVEMLDYIVYSYSVYPWEGKFIPNVACGRPLDTGDTISFTVERDDDGEVRVREFRLGMNFDDARTMFPLWILGLMYVGAC